MAYVTILDGGLASQLATFVDGINNDPLWSARLLHTNPKAITQVHKSYYEAGANVAITASYQASIDGFCSELGIDACKALELIKYSVDLAKQAKKEIENEGKQIGILEIAGSIGPYGAALHDGSEYTGNYIDSLSVEQLIKWHRPRMAALVESGVDYLALETIPAEKEGEALVMLLEEFPQQKAWLSFSCKDAKHTSHGEVLNKVVDKCLSLNPNQLVAIGVNCTDPRYIQPLLSSLNKTIPFVVYPNSGEIWTSGAQHQWISKERSLNLSSYVPSWLDEGARFIGGCCRTTPSDIQQMKVAAETWVANRK